MQAYKVVYNGMCVITSYWCYMSRHWVDTLKGRYITIWPQ